jgi:hypothetical protein
MDILRFRHTKLLLPEGLLRISLPSCEVVLVNAGSEKTEWTLGSYKRAYTQHNFPPGWYESSSSLLTESRESAD